MTWSVRGIDDEVREAALAAARRSGKPVGEWLNGLIRQTAGGPTSPAPGSAASSGGPEPDEVERLERGLLALATRLDRLRGPTPPPLDSRDSRARARADLGPIADAINDEISRLSGDRPRPPSRPERERADAEVQFVAEPASGGDDRLGGVLQALNALDRRLQALATPARTVAAPAAAAYEAHPSPAAARATRDAPPAFDARETGNAPNAPSSLDDLERAVAAISRRQQSLDPARPPGPERRPAARPLLASDMERHFKELSGRLDKLAVEPNSARARDDRLGGELRDLRGLVEQGFATRIAPLAETVSDLRLGLDRVEQEIVRSRRDDRLGAVVDGIAALRDDLAAGIRVEVPPVLAQFERAHADILGRLDGLRAERSDTHAVTDLRHEIADLRAALEARDAAAGLGALESRLVALGRRIDQLVAGRGESFAALDEIRAALAQQRPGPDLGRVEARLEAIDQRMSILRGIEDRIVHLADRLDLMEQGGGRAPAALGVIADEIAALAARLDQLQTAAVAPASEAVLATVADRLEDLGAGIERLERRAGISAGSADMPALGDLADRIEAAAARIDRAPALTAPTTADPALIAAIDDKFAQIARQLDTAEDRFATLGAIEDALVEMHGLLSHRGPTSAVEEAARAAVAEFVRMTETAGSDKALDSVVAELNTLKLQTQGLEARTADGLKAVQEALTSVAGLLQQNRTLDGIGRTARNSREDARPLEPGSGKPEPMATVPPPASPVVAAPPVAPPIAEPDRDAVTEPVVDSTGSSRRADFIAAARRAAQAAQAARIAEPQPELDGSDDEPRRGTLARIGAALRGRAPPVATIAAVLLLAGIATEISLNGLERLRRGLEPVSSRIAAVAPAPTHAPIAAPTPAPEAPQAAHAPAPAAETLGAPVQPGTFGATPVPTTGFVTDPVETGAIAARPATAPAASPAPTAPAAEARPSYPLPEEKIGSQALRQAAANGEPRAAFEVGQRYAEGRGVAQNWVAALEWFRRAAEADFAPAQYRLASGLEKGVAGSRDIAEAKRWYQAAAEHGNVRAMHNLGVLYANERDIATALPWFQKAGDLGLKDSQFNLGIIHALGSGVKQDLAVSYKWFSLAAAQGDQEAAKKRDDIAQYLDKTALASAKLAVDTWKARPIERAANDETSAWSETATARSADPIAERIARVQSLLKAQGAYAGPVDGQASADTKAAVKAFQRKAGLKPTGDVDDAVVRALASGKAA